MYNHGSLRCILPVHSGQLLACVRFTGYMYIKKYRFNIINRLVNVYIISTETPDPMWYYYSELISLNTIKAIHNFFIYIIAGVYKV